MKKKYQTYLRLNLMSLFLIAVSFISVTLAWFAYSGISTVDTTVDVKAWFIELEKDGEKASNNIIISHSNIYPGMETITERITIKNPGDSDAELKYDIVNARVLGDSSNNYVINETTSSEYVEDLLSHEFPFNINMSLSKRYILSKGEESYFEISISWPLDSGRDELDSEWGNKAYDFQKNEINKKNQDSNYQIEPSIQLQISLIAEQYLGNGNTSDHNYNLGDEILVDVVNNTRCDIISPTCIMMYVIDVENTLSDNKVTLLSNPYRSYPATDYYNYISEYNSYVSSWNVNTRPLVVEDLLKIISKDVKNSFLIRNNLSDAIIGNLKYNNRMLTEINKAISGNGYYTFQNNSFPFISSVSCYWTQSNYNSEEGFAIKKENDNITKIYNNSKNELCNVIPVVEMLKINL